MAMGQQNMISILRHGGAMCFYIKKSVYLVRDTVLKKNEQYKSE